MSTTPDKITFADMHLIARAFAAIPNPPRTVKGINHILGCDPRHISAAITNLPSDALKVRVRFRHDRVATAYVRTASGVTAYYLAPDGESMKLLWPVGANRNGGKQ